MSINTEEIYKNQGMMIHTSRSTYFGLERYMQSKVFVSGGFQGSYYCSNPEFYMRIYIYKYKRNIQDSRHDDPYVMVH